MDRKQIIIIVLAVALFLACNAIACGGGLIAGSTLGTIRTRRWIDVDPIRPRERDLEPPMPMPRQPQEWPEKMRWGALVTEVAEDGPAADAGIETGDLILAVDGEPIERDTDLREWMSEYEPGDRITLTVRRGERQAKVQVRLGRRARNSDAPYLGLTYRLIPMPPDVN
jgi:membrane-associated protease RseP (regulator of RpoE activity)